MQCDQVFLRANERQVKRLSGKSGCLVYLMSRDGVLFVRKVSSSPLYNERLLRQAKSVRDALTIDGIRFPKVYHIASDSGLLYYDMEFIRGIPFYEYVSLAPVAHSCEKLDLMFDWIDAMSSNAQRSTAYSADVVHDKVKSVLVASRIGRDFDDVVTAWCRKSFCSSRESVMLPVSGCHGDMTFENVIIDEDGIVCFIDTLDTYLGSYLADASKIMSELLGFWSELSVGHPINPGVYRALQSVALNRKPCLVYNGIAQRLFVVDLLRTLPYVSGERKVAVVSRILEVIDGHDDSTRSRIIEQISRYTPKVDANES